MSDTQAKRPAPFSLRLTPEERARLERDAGAMALSAYVKSRLFDPSEPLPRRRRRVLPDQALLSQLLGRLGASHVPNNLNQLTRLARSGALPVTPELEADLRHACAEIHEIRCLLLKGLGLSGGSS